MQNSTYSALEAVLTQHFGSSTPLDSGNGVRYRSSSRGRVTLYHEGIADGNHAEVAFERTSVAAGAGLPEAQFVAMLADLRMATGRDVKVNTIHLWPRVGAGSPEDVSRIAEALTLILPSCSALDIVVA